MPTIQIRCSIGGKPIFDAPRGERQSNWLEVGQGAYPGHGRVLVRASDWASLTDDAALSLKFWQRTDAAPWSATPTMDIPVRVQAAMPYATGKDTTLDAGQLLELHICDARFASAFASQVTQAFNVQQAGMPYSGTTPLFYASTLNAGVEHAWSAVASAAGVGTSGFAFPTTKPRNIAFSGCAQAEAADRLAKILNASVAFDWSTGALTLIASGTSTAANDALWASFTKHPAMSSMSRYNDRRFPASLRFAFRVASAGADPFAAASRWYAKTIASGFGAAGTVRTIDVGYWFAKEVGGSIINSAELDAIAGYLLAANVLGRFSPVGDAMQPGIWPFKPDGKFRRVLWSFGADGVSTTVRVNSDLPIRAASRVRNEDGRPGWLEEPVGAAFSARTIDGRTQVDTAQPSGGTGVVLKITSVSGGSYPYLYMVTEQTIDSSGVLVDQAANGLMFNLWEYPPVGNGQQTSFAGLGTVSFTNLAVGSSVNGIRHGAGVYTCSTPMPTVPACAS